MRSTPRTGAALAVHREVDVPEVRAADLVLDEPAAGRAVELAELDLVVDEALGVPDSRGRPNWAITGREMPIQKAGG